MECMGDSLTHGGAIPGWVSQAITLVQQEGGAKGLKYAV